MPTQISNPDQTTKNCVLTPLLSAHLNGHLGTTVLDFATTLFGPEVTEADLKQEKEDTKAYGHKNGGFGQTVVCTSLMRAWQFLRSLGEMENAEELRGVAVKHFGEEMVADVGASVSGGN